MAKSTFKFNEVEYNSALSKMKQASEAFEEDFINFKHNFDFEGQTLLNVKSVHEANFNKNSTVIVPFMNLINKYLDTSAKTIKEANGDIEKLFK